MNSLFFQIALLIFSTSLFAEVSKESLLKELPLRAQKVREFKFIKEQAERMGLRVWLFGGTASSLGHYVRWDLERENGDKKYQSERFDYDYTNIFRSTQDLDIVIDGTPENAEAFQNLLETKFPYLQGDKAAWEVRLLRGEHNGKIPLLNNSDFLNQHTDSNSTGLIELTTPPKGEVAVRDLFHWDQKDSPFIEDLSQNQVQYRFSDKHDSTKFFQEGRNPPIFSVIRFLTKVVQSEAGISPKDKATITKIINDWNPNSLSNDYTKKWVEKNAKKIFQNAVDIESAWNLIDEIGLREKLKKTNPKTEEGSLTQLMDREPLRGFPVGTGDGKTAKQLGLSDIAHETSDFTAYESITMSKKGVANFFISREGKTGEAAAFGNGLYTRKGNEGARGSGYTIHLKLKPDAKEGTDFKRVSNDYVLILNKDAVEVVSEKLDIEPSEWLDLIKKFENKDRGVYEKLSRKIHNRILNMTEGESASVKENILRIAKGTSPINEFVANELTFILEHAPDLHIEPSDMFNLFLKTAVRNNKDYSFPNHTLSNLISHAAKDPKEKEALLTFLHAELLKSDNAGPVIEAWCRTPISKELFQIEPWFDMLAKKKGLRSWDTAAWEQLGRRLVHYTNALSPDEKKTLGEKIISHLKKGNEDLNYNLLRMWFSLPVAQEASDPKAWISLLANYKSSDWLESEYKFILNENIKKLTKEKRTELLKTAEEILNKKKVSEPFFKVWNGLDIAKDNENFLIERIHKGTLTPNQAEILGSSEVAQEKTWKEALTHLNGKTFESFAKGFFRHDGYGSPLPLAEEKRKSVPLYLERLIESKKYDSIGGMGYIFREPYAQDWGSELDKTITTLIEKKRWKELGSLGHYLFMQSGGGVNKWGDQLLKTLKALADAKDKEAFREAIRSTSLKRFRQASKPDPLLVALEYAIQMKDPALINEIGGQIAGEAPEDSIEKISSELETAMKQKVANRTTVRKIS